MSSKNIGSRIKQIRSFHKLSQRAFGEKLDRKSSGYISEVETSKTKPGSDLLYSLIRAYKININWLLTGEGSMFMEGSDTTANTPQTCENCGQPYNLASLIEEKEKQLQEKERVIVSNEKMIELLRQENSKLKQKLGELE